MPGQRHPVAVAVSFVLEPMPEVVQLRAVALQFADQLGRRNSLGNPAHNQDEAARPPFGAVQGRLGEGVEDSTAIASTVIGHRSAMATMNL